MGGDKKRFDMKKEFRLLIIEEDVLNLPGWDFFPGGEVDQIFSAGMKKFIWSQGQNSYHIFYKIRSGKNKVIDEPKNKDGSREEFLSWLNHQDLQYSDCGLIVSAKHDIGEWEKANFPFIFRMLDGNIGSKGFLSEVNYFSSDQLYFDGQWLHFPQKIGKIPVLWENQERVIQMINHRSPIFFFDYDGTLSPIVSRPEDAVLPEKTKELLSRLAGNERMTIISGRDKEDVKKRVGLSGVYYAGSHGFEIEDPLGRIHAFAESNELKKEIRSITSILQESLLEIPGVEIEPKEYAVAVHYRNVEKTDQAQVKSIVHEVVQSLPSLKISGGKDVLEVRSAEEWNKGKAMLWIAEQLDFNTDEDILIYVGDDLTDEDAFRIMPGGGISILVGDHGDVSFADFRIHHFDEINRLLTFLIEKI